MTRYAAAEVGGEAMRGRALGTVFFATVIRIPIDENGNPEEGQLFLEEIERVPDGLAFDAAGNVQIACYEPSRMYRVSSRRKASALGIESIER